MITKYNINLIIFVYITQDFPPIFIGGKSCGKELVCAWKDKKIQISTTSRVKNTVSKTLFEINIVYIYFYLHGTTLQEVFCLFEDLPKTNKQTNNIPKQPTDKQSNKQNKTGVPKMYTICCFCQ